VTIDKSMFRVRVQKKEHLSEDIISLILTSLDGDSLPPFSAGAHIDVALPNGMVRQYSLAKIASEPMAYEIAILRDSSSRGGSESAHRDIKEGSQLLIGAPRNHFPLINSARSLLFAGGIGITPIMAMAAELEGRWADFELHYCARSPERAAYMNYLQASGYKSRVHFHYDDGHAEQRLDVLTVLGRGDPGTHLYACGPKGFIDFIVESARSRGWAQDNIHVEHFSGQIVSSSDDRTFVLCLSRSGITVPVPAGQSAAQALLDHGLEIPLSCEQGVCGSCLLRVLEGTPDHRDVFLSDSEKAENNCFTPCCSRAKTASLLIDL